MSAERASRRAAGSRRAGTSARGTLLVNLAAQPFVNQRPAQRFAMVAWAVAAVLIGINVALWLDYRHESTSLRARLASTRSEIETRSRSVVQMNEELDGLRLGAQNAQVAFLNARIAERTFPWSLLFERIATTLPDGVRLKSLNPVFARPDDTGRSSRPERGKAAKSASPPEELVNLRLLGTAKNDDSLYELVDALFASPSFTSPRLHQETDNGAGVEFTVDVDYRPRYTPEASETTETTETSETSEASETHRPAVADDDDDDAGSSDDDEPAAADGDEGEAADAGAATAAEVSE